MLDIIEVWWIILTRVGLLGRTGRQADLWIRHFIVEALREEGVLDYLEEPRTYGQIVARFNFIDSDYTREVFATLSSGRDNLLVKTGESYRLNPATRLPSYEYLIQHTPSELHDMSIFRDFAWRIPARMRQEPIVFTRRFEEEGPALFNFDQSLSTKIYAALRQAAFAFVNEKELRGKKVLDVGCGSGNETADIWLWLKGDVRITAVDPVPGLLELASSRFSELVEQSSRGGRPPLDEANHPEFYQMSAMSLDFPDETFDAVYHSLILHWLPDPEHGVREIARVLKPGGLAFGTQITRPMASSYMNLIIQVHESVSGFFWTESFRRFYAQAGVPIEIATPAGIFRGRKVARQA